MLRELHIRNYALIERLDLEFASGFTVLTGETGAGKSIILDCLGLLLGQRALTEAIRTGAESATIEGGFDVPENPELLAYLEEIGVDTSDGYLVISREITRSGRSKCRINGGLATVSMLADLARYLVELHGQHDNQQLLSPESHVDWLDRLGGVEVQSLREEVQSLYLELQSKTGQLEKLRRSERERVQRLDLLQFQIHEIEAAKLKPGEDEDLRERRSLLQNLDRLMNATKESYTNLVGDGERLGARDLLGQSVAALESVSFDKGLQVSLELLRTALFNVEEAVASLREYMEELQVDPAELDEVEARLALIHQLQRKYGDSIEKILQYQEEIASEVEDLSHADVVATSLEREIAECEAKLSEAASKLSKKRRTLAAKLEKAVESELAQLNMSRAQFVVRFGEFDGGQSIQVDGRILGVRQSGIDNIEFLISANPGEEPKPLNKVASGGELSRIMLALKSILATVDTIPTLVFDEVDTGIGGKTALTVAEKLARLGCVKQVLCVTHLPQVAAAGRQHLMVEKHVSDDERTRVEVVPLVGAQRIEELARMLGGRETEATLNHAKELVNLGQRWSNLSA